MEGAGYGYGAFPHRHPGVLHLLMVLRRPWCFLFSFFLFYPFYYLRPLPGTVPPFVLFYLCEQGLPSCEQCCT